MEKCLEKSFQINLISGSSRFLFAHKTHSFQHKVLRLRVSDAF